LLSAASLRLAVNTLDPGSAYTDWGAAQGNAVEEVAVALEMDDGLAALQRLQALREAKLMFLQAGSGHRHDPGGGVQRLPGTGAMKSKGLKPSMAACIAKVRLGGIDGESWRPASDNERGHSTVAGFSVLQRLQTSRKGKLTLPQASRGQSQQPGFSLAAGGVFTALSSTVGFGVWHRLHSGRWGKLMFLHSSRGQRHDPSGGRNLVVVGGLGTANQPTGARRLVERGSLHRLQNALVG